MPSKFDPDQITRYGFEDETFAHRVIVVGGSLPEFNVQASQINKEIQVVEVPKPFVVTETKIEKIEIPTNIIQKEIQVIEIPKIIKEVEIKEVIKEIPVILTEVKLVEIPKVITEEKIVYKDLPMFFRVCLAAQILITIAMLLKK